MRWRSLIVAGAALLPACVSGVSDDPSDQPALVTLAPSTAPTTTEPSTTSVQSAAESSVEAEVDEEQTIVEVVAISDPTIGSRFAELTNYGYGVRPSTSDGFHEIPDLSQRFPSMSVRSLDLNWGIDSSAVLVIADGEPAMIAEAESVLAESTSWTRHQDGWLVGLYKGGLAAGFEMKPILDTISSIMDPDQACEADEQACPFGAEVGFPPPPPALVANGSVDAASVPFRVVEVDSATMVGADQHSIHWVRDLTAYSAWDDPTDPAQSQRLGPASLITTIGCSSFVVDPGRGPDDGAVALRSCVDESNQMSWAVPQGWQVDGLAFIGTFGQHDYQLVVSARDAGDEPLTVAVPLDERFFDPPRGRATVALDTLPPAGGGKRWTQPKRSRLGGLLVVEQRADEWFLIDDALGVATELLRSNRPIISYAVDGGNRHLVLVTGGADGPNIWWIDGAEVTRLAGSATSIAWNGNHPSWLRDQAGAES